MIKLYYTFANPESESFIKKSLKEFFGRDDFAIQRTQSGKPYTDRAEFSLSHTDGLTVCAVSEAPVGADCEKVRSINNKERILARFAKIQAENVTDKEFFEKWTTFESSVKLFGEKSVDCPLVFEKDVFTKTIEIDGFIIAVSSEKEGEDINGILL